MKHKKWIPALLRRTVKVRRKGNRGVITLTVPKKFIGYYANITIYSKRK